MFIMIHSARVHMAKNAQACDINSITFLLYTLKIFILRLIMLLTSTSKSTQPYIVHVDVSSHTSRM